MVDIFISYAREDQDAVRRLADALEAQGWSVFWDRTIPAGETWRSYIGKALDDARCVVVAWSVASIESHWVQEEAEDARNKNILIPVLLAPIIPPIGFRSITAANLVGWDGNAEDELFVKFRADISRKLGDPPALIKERERQRAEAKRKKVAELAEMLRLVAERKDAELKEKQRAEAERRAAGIAEMQRLVAERKAVEFEEKQRAEAEREDAELKEKQRAEAERMPAVIAEMQRLVSEHNAVVFEERQRAESKRKAREQETKQRRDAEALPERRGQPAVAGANEEARESPNHKHATPEPNPLRKKMTIALAVVVSIAAVIAFQPASSPPKSARQAAVPLPKLVRIPAGSFMMGSDNGESNEQPVRAVHIDQPFYLGATEVTFEQYDAFAEATGRELPNNEDWGRSDRPVINVDWADAKAYVQWLSEATGSSCRLPSEAEWEYAARAGTESRYALPAPEGGSLSGYANCADCGRSEDVAAELNEHIGKRTLPVASFPANAWGLHDMHGNVLEWVEDCWHRTYKNAPDNGSAWLEENGGECGKRVLRGGSWFFDRGYARSAHRSRYYPNSRYDNLGFRVLCSSPILSTDH